MNLRAATATSLGALLFAVAAAGEPIEESWGRQAGALEMLFRSELHALQAEGEAIRFAFRGDRKFVVDGQGEPSGDFSVTPGQSFSVPPDHHSQVQFEVRSTGTSGITLGYESRFDHRSFGRDKISVDRGSFQLPWIAP